MTSSPSTPSSKLRTTMSWVVRIILAIAFIGAGIFKLSGHPAAIEEFDQVRLGQWFRYFTAATEILGAVLLLWPRTVFYGAVLMGAVCVGAFVAQLTALHGDIIHTIVLAVIFAIIAWKWRAQVAAFPLLDSRR